MQKILIPKRSFRLAILLVLVVVAGLVGWRFFGKKQPTTQYQTATVERGTLVSSVSASGQILSANIVNVATNARGVVKKVFVKEGDKVTTGQKILELTLDLDGQQKNAAAYSSYLSAKNSLASTQASLFTLESQRSVAKKKLVDDALTKALALDDPIYVQEYSDWQAAEAKYNNQGAVIDQAKIAVSNAWLSYQLTSSTVTAPSAGSIFSLLAVEGLGIGQSNSSSDTSVLQRIAVIQTEANPLATFNLSEIDISKVKAGQKVTITLDSFSDKTFTGKVVSVDRTGSTTSGVTSYPAIVQFDTQVSQVLPNMASSAEIIIEAKDNVLFVPFAAVQNQGGQTTVRILKSGQAQSVLVETGLTSDTQIEIISGLSEGDDVITSIINTGTGQSSGSSPFGGSSLFRSVGGGGRRPD
ncbi:MAG: efflux RND transporter periplasmic adaptor subunit [bacterium]|nr:efflux RND transporter periplasmic adaptor subunit [bacterium]